MDDSLQYTSSDADQAFVLVGQRRLKESTDVEAHEEQDETQHELGNSALAQAQRLLRRSHQIVSNPVVGARPSPLVQQLVPKTSSADTSSAATPAGRDSQGTRSQRSGGTTSR